LLKNIVQNIKYSFILFYFDIIFDFVLRFIFFGKIFRNIPSCSRISYRLYSRILHIFFSLRSWLQSVRNHIIKYKIILLDVIFLNIKAY